MRVEFPVIHALGDAAFTLDFGGGITPQNHARVMGAAAAIEALRAQGTWAGLREIVPSFSSLTVHFDPDHADPCGLEQGLLEAAQSAGSLEITGRNWCLPACFDADMAPDLAALAARQGMSPDAVVTLLTQTVLRVYTLGFLPGFAYMGGVPEALQVPRLETPRVQVPARSLAITGAMCAAYPFTSPGGWHLVGRTPLRLFNPADAVAPAVLAAGDHVQWQQVDRAEFETLEALAEAGRLDVGRFLRRQGAA